MKIRNKSEKCYKFLLEFVDSEKAFGVPWIMNFEVLIRDCKDQISRNQYSLYTNRKVILTNKKGANGIVTSN